MKFGKYFRYQLQETLPTWRDNYLDYKALKRLIRRLPHQGDAPSPLPAPVAAEGEDVDGQGSVGQGRDCFARTLDMELNKLNDFYMEREEWYVIRLQEFKERIERVKAKRKNDAFTIQEMLDIREDFLVIRGELILLQSYSSLNFVGLVKILKKYDKRTGGVLSPPYTQHARHQPFFATEPLTRLVQECQANLELLFPIIIEGDLLVLQ